MHSPHGSGSGKLFDGESEPDPVIAVIVILFGKAASRHQVLCDERALLAAMAYVGLNPIRAGMARSLDDSDHTSIQRRIHTDSMGSIRWGQVHFLTAHRVELKDTPSFAKRGAAHISV